MTRLAAAADRCDKTIRYIRATTAGIGLLVALLGSTYASEALVQALHSIEEGIDAARNEDDITDLLARLDEIEKSEVKHEEMRFMVEYCRGMVMACSSTCSKDGPSVKSTQRFVSFINRLRKDYPEKSNDSRFIELRQKPGGFPLEKGDLARQWNWVLWFLEEGVLDAEFD